MTDGNYLESEIQSLKQHIAWFERMIFGQLLAAAGKGKGFWGEAQYAFRLRLTFVQTGRRYAPTAE